MTIGEKIKEIRKKFGLSQEEFAEIMKVSRQAITKWETNIALPDTNNLKLLSDTFNVSIDNLLDNKSSMPILKMRIELDSNNYKNKISSYSEILKEYYSSPWKIYILTRGKKLNKLEAIFDFIIGAGTLELGDALSDMSPYYLVKKDDIRLLVNIENYTLTSYELNNDINENKFVFNKSIFKKHNELILK